MPCRVRLHWGAQKTSERLQCVLRRTARDPGVASMPRTASLWVRKSKRQVLHPKWPRRCWVRRHQQAWRQGKRTRTRGSHTPARRTDPRRRRPENLPHRGRGCEDAREIGKEGSPPSRGRRRRDRVRAPRTRSGRPRASSSAAWEPTDGEAPRTLDDHLINLGSLLAILCWLAAFVVLASSLRTGTSGEALETPR